MPHDQTFKIFSAESGTSIFFFNLENEEVISQKVIVNIITR